MSAKSTTTDAKFVACRYVLFMLVQRLDPKHPGLIDDMLKGADRDFSTVETSKKLGDSPRAVFARAVFAEVKCLLQQAGSYKDGSFSVN